MKSPGLTERFSLFKLLTLSLSLLLTVFTGCTQDQSSKQVAELPSDQKITETIQSQLVASDAVAADSIDIKTKDGIVTLSGSTTNLLAKKEATKIAESTYGVLSVVNNLKITTSRPDKAIDQDVDLALSNDPVTETWEIESSVNNGVVTLKGVVESWQESQLAATVASRVKGVKKINNSIIVNYDQARSDEEMKAEIEKKIKMNSEVDGNMVRVNVADDSVSLTGAIGSAHEKSLVADLARVTGVEDVDVDRLEVHPEYENAMYREDKIETLTNSEIKQAITSALKYDPRVPEHKITVSIDGNTAILEGEVLNLNSKLAAKTDALNTAGISTVANNIEVNHKVVVEPEVPTTDKALTKRLEYSIMRDPYVDKTAVDVEVNNGIATITGTLDSQFEKEQLNQIASNVKGITAVNNNVKIATAETST